MDFFEYLSSPTGANTILSLSSFFIAIVTAIALITQLSRSRINLRIETTPTTIYEWETDRVVKLDEMCTKFFKWVRITNKSSVPVTIYQFIIQKGNTTFYSDCIDANDPVITSCFCDNLINDDMSEVNIPFHKILTPLIALQPYEVIEGHIFFISIGGQLNDGKTYYLQTLAAKKTFYTKFKLDTTQRDL